MYTHNHKEGGMKKGRICTPKKGLLYGYITPILTVILLVVLVGLSIYTLMRKSNNNTAIIIDRDLQTLADVFHRIDMDCKIIHFDYPLNRIDFLNVKSFVGTDVGAMHLAYPEKWKGPYLDANPRVQGQEYMIVVTHKGCFITPGTEVQLPNGKVVGVDIILNEETDIETMMKPGGAFNADGKPLAAKLNVGASVFDQLLREHVITLDEE
jgi:hypothetical protein